MNPTLITDIRAVLPMMDPGRTLHIGGVWGVVRAGETWLGTDGARFIWSADNILVIFSINGRFYAQPAAGFRVEVTTYPYAAAGRRLAPTARILEIEMKLLMGVAAGASTGAFAALIGTEIVAFIAENRDQFQTWRRQFQTVMEVRAKLKQVAPTLYDKLFWASLTRLWEDVKGQFPEAVTPETISFGVGVILGSLGKAATKGRFTVLGVLVIVLKQLATRFTLNVLPEAAHLTAAEYKRLAEEIIKRLKESGIIVSEADAMKILEEAAKHPKEISAALKELQSAFP